MGEMKGIGQACTDDDVCLEWNENSFNLLIKNYHELHSEEGGKEVDKQEDCPVRCLHIGKLYGCISDATFRKKKDRVILTLVKRVEEDVEPKDWPTIRCNDGGENET